MASTMSTAVGERVLPHNQRASTVWSSGGGAYDEVSAGIADAIEHCVRRLQPQPGERILDLATGTGWTSRALARRGAQVTGVDIADGLLEAARQTAASERLPITYEVGDAEQLPYGDGAFDAVASTFGVMFASRPEAAAAELARVCRRGGRMALAVWTADGTLSKMFEVMKRYMPAPPVPPPPSPFEWGRPERIQALLGSAFDLQVERGTCFYREPDGETIWKIFSTGYGPTHMLARNLEPERREALHRDFVAFHDAFRTELGVTVTREYLVVAGVRR